MTYARKVYAIRHNVTNRVYVGSSGNVDRRFNQHLYALRSHTHIVGDMQKDFDEHGEDFTLTILDTIKDASESEKEFEWMDKYQSFVRGVGYNYQDCKRRHASRSGVFRDKDVGIKIDQPLTENERELLDIIHGSEDPMKMLYAMHTLLHLFLHPDLAKDFSDAAQRAALCTQTTDHGI